MTEPLYHLYQKYKFNPNEISRIIKGDKYLAVLLKNGSIGVCARLHNPFQGDLENIVDIDLTIISHRILYTAYLNASLNYEHKYGQRLDIFNVIDFKKYKNLVMIGYFKPLAEKLRSGGIAFSIFDIQKSDEEVLSMDKQKESIVNADGLIITATSIFNNSFLEMVNFTSPGACDIFVLGPSAILSYELLNYPNVRKVFGFIFEKNDRRVLNIIEAGGGKRKFNKFGDKVYI